MARKPIIPSVKTYFDEETEDESEENDKENSANESEISELMSSNLTSRQPLASSSRQSTTMTPEKKNKKSTSKPIPQIVTRSTKTPLKESKQGTSRQSQQSPTKSSKTPQKESKQGTSKETRQSAKKIAQKEPQQGTSRQTRQSPWKIFQKEPQQGTSRQTRLSPTKIPQKEPQQGTSRQTRLSPINIPQKEPKQGTSKQNRRDSTSSSSEGIVNPADRNEDDSEECNPLPNINQNSRKTKPKPKSRRKQTAPQFNALREIRKLQSTQHLIVPKLPFSRVVKEILLNPSISDGEKRITRAALEALQEAAEVFLTILFEDSYRCTMHRGRVTLIIKDMELVRALRGVNDPGYIPF